MPTKLFLRNETEQCIEYVVEEGAGSKTKSAKTLHLNIGDEWKRLEPQSNEAGTASKEYEEEDVERKVVVFKNVPANTRLLFFPADAV